MAKQNALKVAPASADDRGTIRAPRVQGLVMRIVAMVAALVLATSRMIAELYPLLFAVIIVLGAAIALLGGVLGLVFPARADQVRVRLATTEHDPVIF